MNQVPALLVIAFGLVYNTIFGQLGIEYLEENKSNAIVLHDETEFIIETPETSTLKRTYEVIVKNKYARAPKSVVIYYDQFQSVKNANVEITDLLGNEIEKYKLKDFDDIAVGNSGTASDSRVKYIECTYNKYPYRISVEYEIEKNGSLHYPVWRPQPEEKLRVVSASFKVIDKSGNSFRYDDINVPTVNITNEGFKTYKWQIKDVGPFEYEKFNYNEEDYVPLIYTAPTNFEIEGYKGEMSSWQSFGTWAGKLNADRNDISNLQLQELDKVVARKNTPLEKISAVYNYLQTNTRYVSIQLGIGGWQPFKASFVHEKKYGDCKALSFYTKALLERYGINSYYTLIRAGRNAANMKNEFPNAHFNHAIVTVPLTEDTVFLECTSQTKPFAYLGTFTSNRNALLITEDGGKLIRTKKYTPGENVQVTIARINLGENGTAKVNVNRIFKGLEIDNHSFHHLYYQEEKEKNKWLGDNYDWGDHELLSFELTPLTEGEIPECGFNASLDVRNEAVKMGKRLFLDPGKYFNSYLSKLPNEERTKAIRIRYGYTQRDSIKYNTPDAYRIEKGLTQKNLSCKFGRYERTLVHDGESIIYTRKFVLSDGHFAPEDYEAFKEFINKVVKYDREKLVLVNKT